MTRKMLFRRAVAGLAKEEMVKRKPKTSGVKCKVHSGLVHYESLCHCPCSGHAENRRLRGEVRRLRRALREIAQQDTPPKNAVPGVCWECGAEITEGENVSGMILCCDRCVEVQHATMSHIAEAALAPRRRKS